MFALVFFGFATLAGIFPLHTWAPTGHVAAPTAASMLLAGVVMKLGAYGCLRVALPLFPAGIRLLAAGDRAGWPSIGIVYAGLVALVQEDLKFVIGYSSVSHMGFVLLGLAAANPRAVGGAVLQMFSHGVIAGLLFAVVGRMVYDRTHTRQLSDLRAMPLYRLLPFAAAVFVIAGAGLDGPARLQRLSGRAHDPRSATWRASPAWAAVARPWASWWRPPSPCGRSSSAFFGPAGPDRRARGPRRLEPITLPEKAGALLLLGATVLVGLRPDLLLNWIGPALQSPLLQAVLKGGAAVSADYRGARPRAAARGVPRRSAPWPSSASTCRSSGATDPAERLRLALWGRRPSRSSRPAFLAWSGRAPPARSSAGS